MTKKYLNNEKFEEVIFGYQENPTEYETEFISMFNVLIDNIIQAFNFKLIDSDDAKQDCFVLVLKTVPNFTKEKGTAFNYFTTIIVNQLKLMYTKNKKYNKKIENYTNWLKQDFDFNGPYSPYWP